jgi:hypothetical protein
MIIAQNPTNEAERLATLKRSIFLGSPEEKYNHITEKYLHLWEQL